MNNGKQGERLVHNLLTQCGYYVLDVSAVQEYQQQDIDIVATEPTLGIRATIEVKYDTRMARTGNLFIETRNPRSQGGKGWYYFCQADFIYYIDAINQQLHIMRTGQLREFIRKYESYLRMITTGDGAQGYLLSVEDAPIYNTISLRGLEK